MLENRAPEAGKGAAVVDREPISPELALIDPDLAGVLAKRGRRASRTSRGECLHCGWWKQRHRIREDSRVTSLPGRGVRSGRRRLDRDLDARDPRRGAVGISFDSTLQCSSPRSSRPLKSSRHGAADRDGSSGADADDFPTRLYRLRRRRPRPPPRASRACRGSSASRASLASLACHACRACHACHASGTGYTARAGSPTRVRSACPSEIHVGASGRRALLSDLVLPQRKTHLRSGGDGDRAHAASPLDPRREGLSVEHRHVSLDRDSPAGHARLAYRRPPGRECDLHV